MKELCKYKDIFGKPEKGFHSTRFMGVAIYDVIGTLIVSLLISYYTKYSFVYVAIFLFILGIILHNLFCVRTTVDKILFSN